jgi:hypothetical protein
VMCFRQHWHQKHKLHFHQPENSNCFLETQLLERARVFSGFTFQIYWKQFFWSRKNKFRLQCHQKRKIHKQRICDVFSTKVVSKTQTTLSSTLTTWKLKLFFGNPTFGKS